MTFSQASSAINKKEDFFSVENKKIVKKCSLRKIDVSELPDKLPDFRNHLKTKDDILAEWLVEWIEKGLSHGKLKVNDLLPTKNQIAQKTRVSIGTVQTAIRTIEDEGYVESKQRIGTFISDKRRIEGSLRKQISKREHAIETLKKIIIKNGYRVGEALPSSRELSKFIGSAPNTTRLALEYLSKHGVIESKASRRNRANWILSSVPQIKDQTEDQPVIDSDTLVDQVERDLKDFITKNFKVGDKLVCHFDLADKLKVSIKTVHDAMKRLVEQGILKSKRGRYGTLIMRMPTEKQTLTGLENEIFAPAVEASLYNYEMVEFYLKEYFRKNFKVGDKTPSMGKLAQELNLSSNTIRKALQRLSEDGIVSFTRGRYGGTFLNKIPELQTNQKVSLSWISLNPEHKSVYNKKI